MTSEKACVNAHDRCFGGAGGPCPYCEPAKRKPKPALRLLPLPDRLSPAAKLSVALSIAGKELLEASAQLDAAGLIAMQPHSRKAAEIIASNQFDLAAATVNTAIAALREYTQATGAAA